MQNFMINEVFHLEILSHLNRKTFIFSLCDFAKRSYSKNDTQATNSITTINNPVQCPGLYSTYNMPIYTGVINENNKYESIIYNMNSLPSGYVSR